MDRLKRIWALAAGLALTGVAMTGCASIPMVLDPPEGPPLEGPVWLLESTVDSQGETHSVLPRSQVLIVFQDGRISGGDGCNQYSGTYTLEGSKLTIRPEGSTRRACPELIMAQAAAFTAGLSSTAAYEIRAARLRRKSAQGGTVMVLQALPQELVGTCWQAIAVNNGHQAVVSLIEGTEITAEFGAEATVFGLAGCNRYKGPYALEGKQIAIGPLATTRKACPQPEGVETQEAAYLAALEKSTIYQLAGTKLTLRDAQGATQVEFVLP